MFELDSLNKSIIYNQAITKIESNQKIKRKKDESKPR